MHQLNPSVVIVDYGLGNLFSVLKACEYAGIKARISSDKKDIETSDALILPGVGAFGEAMNNLKKLDLVSILQDYANSDKQIMCVCLGMQLLMTESEEFGTQKGLNIIEGTCKKFQTKTADHKLRVPQIQWNTIYPPEGTSFNEDTLLSGVKPNEFMYFVHSFYVEPADKKVVLSLTNFEGIIYCSSLDRENIHAFQFHPEKSGNQGLKIYQNFRNVL